ncbi:hypothetical protein FOZ62_006647, partial [Perkinsus olseni]
YPTLHQASVPEVELHGWPEVAASLSRAVVEKLHLPYQADRSYAVLPACLDGGLLTTADVKRSSTYKERKSQLLAAYRYLPMMYAPAFIVTDNRNSTHWWHNYEEFIQTEEVLSVVDKLARVNVYPQGSVKLTVSASEEDPLRAVIDAELERGEGEVDADLDLNTVREEQAVCPECAQFRNKDGFSVIDGVLYRVLRYDYEGNLVRQVCVPKSMRVQLVDSVHKEVHVSGRQLRWWLQSFAWWPKMGYLCSRAKTSCRGCQKVDDTGRVKIPYGTRAPDRHMAPWRKIGIDVSHVGHGGMLLTACCYFCGYMDYEVVTDQLHSSYLRALETICLRTGYPLYIQSDNEFRSREVAEWSTRNGIVRWSFGWPNHGESGGWYERRHRMVVDSLRRWIAATGDRWNDPFILAHVRWTINHSEIGDSNLCPQILMFSRPVVLPCMRAPVKETFDEEFENLKLRSLPILCICEICC